MAAGCAWGAPPDELPGDALLARHKQLTGQLRQNQFGRPLVLNSSESASGLNGDVYAVVAYPLHTVNTVLGTADQWCEIMILHINTKYCHALTGPQGTLLQVYIGLKTPQSLTDATLMEFQYRETSASPDYFAVMLNAKTGPLSTSDYKIGFEAVALPGNMTFLHLGYAYGMGFSARVAMQTYLATAGSEKVGFSEVARLNNDQVHLISGVRGVVERNTMRYFLAIDSALAVHGLPQSAQLEARLQDWFTAVERYPRQLHEMDRPTYLEMKRAEHARQQTAL
jgi:hypothetical protein